jgi:DNA-binding IclR family transcriptional regulator
MSRATNPAGLRFPFLGPRQIAALRIIARAKQPPTRSELGRRLGITRESAHLLVDKLIAQRLVSRTPATHRNIYATESGYAALQRPAKGGAA